MRRREFIALLGGAPFVPRAVYAQQRPVVGVLGTTTARAWAAPLTAFHQGLSEAGYAEGRNVAVDDR